MSFYAICLHATSALDSIAKKTTFEAFHMGFSHAICLQVYLLEYIDREKKSTLESFPLIFVSIIFQS